MNTTRKATTAEVQAFIALRAASKNLNALRTAVGTARDGLLKAWGAEIATAGFQPRNNNVYDVRVIVA